MRCIIYSDVIRYFDDFYSLDERNKFPGSVVTTLIFLAADKTYVKTYTETGAKRCCVETS